MYNVQMEEYNQSPFGSIFSRVRLLDIFAVPKQNAQYLSVVLSLGNDEPDRVCS
jgi:hypothetical protein